MGVSGSRAECVRHGSPARRASLCVGTIWCCISQPSPREQVRQLIQMKGNGWSWKFLLLLVLGPLMEVAMADEIC